MKKKSFDRFISAITSFAFVFSLLHCFHDRIIKTNSILTSAAAASESVTENPFNYQNDEEVPYDRKSWVQPREWNSPKIDPKDYNGGIMLFFDKIGLEPEYAKGTVQRVYFSITGATEPVSRIKLHFFYDTRLTVKENSNGEVMNAGKAVQDFTTGSAMVEEGQLVFYAYSDENKLTKGSLFTIDFIVPESAEQGEIYPFGISYTNDGIAADTFINTEQNDAGRLQMTYVFTKGIYNGYIKVKGEKIIKTKYDLGDVNNDGLINAIDASSVLAYYALVSTNKNGGYTAEQKLAADVDSDGAINAIDASNILAYYAYASTTKEDVLPLEEYMEYK